MKPAVMCRRGSENRMDVDFPTGDGLIRWTPGALLSECLCLFLWGLAVISSAFCSSDPLDRVLLTQINFMRTLCGCLCGKLKRSWSLMFVRATCKTKQPISMPHTSQHSPLIDVNAVSCLVNLSSLCRKYLDALVVTVHWVQVGQVTRSAGTRRFLWRSHMICWTQNRSVL